MFVRSGLRVCIVAIPSGVQMEVVGLDIVRVWNIILVPGHVQVILRRVVVPRFLIVIHVHPHVLLLVLPHIVVSLTVVVVLVRVVI
jgi:hypothetical protein